MASGDGILLNWINLLYDVDVDVDAAAILYWRFWSVDEKCPSFRNTMIKKRQKMNVMSFKFGVFCWGLEDLIFSSGINDESVVPVGRFSVCMYIVFCNHQKC